MSNLRNIKDRITSVQNTQKITRAMKMVAAAKVKKAENAVKMSRPFTFELYKMFCWAYKQTLKDKCEKIKTEQSFVFCGEIEFKRLSLPMPLRTLTGTPNRRPHNRRLCSLTGALGPCNGPLALCPVSGAYR